MFFFYTDPATTEIYTLSLHDALPIFDYAPRARMTIARYLLPSGRSIHKEFRSEEHTSELQSHHDLVCRLLLEKKKNIWPWRSITMCTSRRTYWQQPIMSAGDSRKILR